MQAKEFPVMEKAYHFELAGEPGFYRKITFAEVKDHPGAFQAIYNESSLGWFVGLGEEKTVAKPTLGPGTKATTMDSDMRAHTENKPVAAG